MPSRLKPLKELIWSTEQRIAIAKIEAYLRAPASGAFAVWAHQAGVAEGGFQLMLAHQFEDRLERRLFEVAVLTVARNWSASFQWTAHAAAAQKLGLAPDTIESIQLGRRPAFDQDDERATYDLVNELTFERRISQPTYDQAMSTLGSERVVALISAAGFYAMAAMASVAFETPLPDGLGKPVQFRSRAHLPILPPQPPEPPALGANSRVPTLRSDAITTALKIEAAKIEAHFKSPLPGPFQIWAHQPSVANGVLGRRLLRRDNGDGRGGYGSAAAGLAAAMLRGLELSSTARFCAASARAWKMNSASGETR